MKKLLCVILMLVLLGGCDAEAGENAALRLRAQLNSQGCSFDTKITADYGDEFFEFTLACQYDTEGNLQFTVIAPDSINSICGNISSAGGNLKFEDTALAFALLADGQLSPVCGPWVMMKALHSGYLVSAGADGEYTRITIRDSYADNAMTVDVWLNGDTPVHGEIIWKNRRILTMEVENFQVG